MKHYVIKSEHFHMNFKKKNCNKSVIFIGFFNHHIFVSKINRNGLANMLGGPIGKVLVTLKLGLILEDKVGLFTFALVNILAISLLNNALSSVHPP
jgi:hypothetical protein